MKLVKNLLRLLALAIMLVYFPFVFGGYITNRYKEVKCTNILTNVAGMSEQNILITDNDIRSILRRDFPALTGTPIERIELNKIEESISKLAAVQNVEAYCTVNGILHINVTQRQPIAHIIGSRSQCYIDTDGLRIPITNGAYAHALIVNGNVGALTEEDDIIKLCNFIYNDDFWHNMIEQVYITPKNEYILTPRIGDHCVEFGGIDRMESKFSNLKKLYTKGWKPKEWNLYKKVCLKYKGQIICTKI